MCRDAVIKKVYLEYRKEVWDRYRKNRLDPAFDVFWYDSNKCDLITRGLGGGGGTEGSVT